MSTISIKGFQLAGIQWPGKTTNRNNQSSTDCGILWQKFEKENIINHIPHRLSDTIYAVYFDYEDTSQEKFRYFIGCQIEKNVPVPEKLDTLWIPTQDYKIITAQGKMTDCLTETWKNIWTLKIPRKFGFDFEVYDERSHNWNDAEVDIYLSLLMDTEDIDMKKKLSLLP